MASVRKVYGVLGICVLALLHIVQVQSYCFSSAPKNDGSSCVFQGKEIHLNTSYQDNSACVECRCNVDGSMHCCGFGHQAGVIAPPPGCAVQRVGCYFKLVDHSDNTKPCVLPLVV